MKPNFALILSHDGISLLHRAIGGWRLIGLIDPESKDLGDQLRYIRRTALDLAGGQFATKLVIPNTQILYTKIDALGGTDTRRTQVIKEALVGLTPYEVNDLLFDWCDAGGGFAHVAAVARETLKEAEDFACEHLLNPVSFVATPEADTLSHEAYFGRTEFSRTFLSQEETIEPDRSIIQIISHSEIPKAPPLHENTPPLHDHAEDVEIDEPFEIEIEAAEFDIENSEDLSSTETTDITGAIKTDFAELDAPTSEDVEHDTDDEAEDMEEQDEEPEAADLDLADAAFVTARTVEGQRETLEPLNLKWVTPRISPSIAGNGSSDTIEPSQEYKAVSVTAPDLMSDEIPIEITDSVEIDSAEIIATRSLPEADDTNAAPRLNLTPVSRDEAMAQNEAESLTIFGARRNETVGGKPKFLGLTLGLGLVATIGTIAFLSGFLGGDGDSSTQVWQTVDVKPETLGEPQTATAVVASGAFIEEPENTIEPAPVVGTEMASLVLPDINSDNLLFPTPEETAQGEFEVDIQAPPSEILTPETAQAAYEVSGIWQLAPSPPVDPEIDRIDGLYVASIDRVVVSNDAVAVPAYSVLSPDIGLPRVPSPAPAGTNYDLDERGLVRASPEGTTSPDGVLIYAGSPAKVPSLRPNSAPLLDLIGITPLTSPLAIKRPLRRPVDLVTKAERARLGGRSLADIAKVRPTLRPASAQENQIVAALTAETAATEPAEVDVASLAGLKISRTPTLRPSNFASAVNRAVAEAVAETIAGAVAESATGTQQDDVVQASAATIAPAGPVIPTKASVAKEATMANAISLSKINLIGIYGSDNARRALIRLKSGRYVKVQIGDNLDGGRVSSITASELLYVKSGRNHVLKMPTG